MALNILIIVISILAIFTNVATASSKLRNYRYGDIFFIGNNTYNVRNVNNVFVNQHCQSIPYTAIIKKPNCFPAYINNTVCGGLCPSIIYPGVFGTTTGIASSNNREKCAACLPSKVIEKHVFLLCLNKKHKFRVTKKKTVQIVVKCRCRQYRCAKRYITYTNNKSKKN